MTHKELVYSAAQVYRGVAVYGMWKGARVGVIRTHGQIGTIFPGYSVINDALPENTALHRNLKRYLLEGNQFGIARRCLKLERVCKVLGESWPSDHET